MRRFDVVSVVLQDELDFAVGEGALTDEVSDGFRNRDFGKAVEDFNDVFCLETNRDRGIEGIGRQLVLMDMGRSITYCVREWSIIKVTLFTC